MFTGIVREIGRLDDVQPAGNGRRLTIAAPGLRADLSAGDSVAVDGVCLTAAEVTANGFVAEAIATTLSRTTLGRLDAGDAVNLEPALALGERLGGHLVQGHVDGTGEVVSLTRDGEQVLLTVRLPDVVAEVTTLHGSIAIQGVSLTVSERPAPGLARVALIPYTLEHTTLGRLAVGDAVNLEGDMLGRFVVDYLKRTGGWRV